MDSKPSLRFWLIIAMALALVCLVVYLGYRSFRTTEAQWASGAWPPPEDARQALRALYLRQLLALGASMLIVLLGSWYAMVSSLRAKRPLQQELETKSRALEELHERLFVVGHELESTHGLWQAVIDGVDEPIMVIGPDYRVKLANRAAREFHGEKRTALETVRCYELSHRREGPCDGLEHPCPVRQVSESRQSVAVVHEHYEANGRVRFVELVASPLWGADGGFGGVVESFHDITQRVRTAQALRSANTFQQLLVEEVRERIARDLHDGLAQLLGYVNTKVMAVRLMLKKQQLELADEHLLQLEEAARQLFGDLRQAIFDLRSAPHHGAGLATMLQDFVSQFGRLSDLPVELNLAPEVGGISLPAETELQLLRIVQESLANVRKHASATRVQVGVRMDNGILEVAISDDGRGFDLENARSSRWPHFGLSIMRERAEAIGADFSLLSLPGEGTRVTVRLEVGDLT